MTDPFVDMFLMVGELTTRHSLPGQMSGTRDFPITTTFLHALLYVRSDSRVSRILYYLSVLQVCLSIVANCLFMSLP